MAKCEGCKWFGREPDGNDGCALGLKRSSGACEGYSRPVEESCRQCEYHIGMGQCKLNLEKECAEDHHGMYTLSRATKRDCEDCDSFRGGRCVKKREPEALCMDYTWWPAVPNWGTEA